MPIRWSCCRTAAFPIKARRGNCLPAEDFFPAFGSCNMWNRGEVSYEIVELELSRPLIALAVPQGRSGLACVVRSSDRPVGFFMEPLREGTVLSPREVAARVMKRCGAQILREKIHDELRGPLARTPFRSLDIAFCTHNRPHFLPL